MDIKKLSQKEIIELIEGDGKIMDFRIKYDNLPVWPLVRAHVLAEIEEYITREKDVIIEKKTSKKYELKKNIGKLWFLLKICIKSKIFNKGKLRKREMLLFPNRNYLRDGTVHENIFGFFISNPNETLIMKYYDDNYRWYKSEADAIFREGFYSILYIVDEMIGRRKNKYDINMSKEFSCYISDKIGVIDEDLINKIEQRVSRLTYYVKQRKRVLETVYNKTQPKYVIMSEASWSYYAAECYFFKEKKIPVFEIAHSMMYEGHRSYWFSDRIYNNDEYTMFLPNMFIVWSEYCKKFLNINTMVVAAGNPEFYYSLKNDYRYAKRSRKDLNVRRFLLNVSSPPFDISQIDRLINDFLLYDAPRSVLVLRFHPLYRHLIPRYRKYTTHTNIVIDNSDGIYSAFGKCDYLISSFSTIVYEALACGMRVFSNDMSSFEGQSLWDDVEFFGNIEELFCMADSEKVKSTENEYRLMYFGEDTDSIDVLGLYINNKNGGFV